MPGSRAPARSRSRDPDADDSDGAGDDHDDRNRLALFRQRLASGDYDAILGQGLRETLRGAAADAGLEAEIGALRLALARLLQEEHDPSRLAAGVSRITGVAVQAARLRQSATSELDEVRSMLLQELDEVERERRHHERQGKEVIRDGAQQRPRDGMPGRAHGPGP